MMGPLYFEFLMGSDFNEIWTVCSMSHFLLYSSYTFQVQDAQLMSSSQDKQPPWHHAKDKAHFGWLSLEPGLCLCLWSLLLGVRKREEQGCHQHPPPGAFNTKKISQCNCTTPNIPVNLQEEVPKPHFDTLVGFDWLKLSTAVEIHRAKVVLNLEIVVFLSHALKPHSLSEENLQARWILLELLSGMCRQRYLFKYRFRISCLVKSLYKERQSVSLLLALRFPVRCTSAGSAFEY